MTPVFRLLLVVCRACRLRAGPGAGQRRTPIAPPRSLRSPRTLWGIGRRPIRRGRPAAPIRCQASRALAGNYTIEPARARQRGDISAFIEKNPDWPEFREPCAVRPNRRSPAEGNDVIAGVMAAGGRAPVTAAGKAQSRDDPHDCAPGQSDAGLAALRAAGPARDSTPGRRGRFLGPLCRQHPSGGQYQAARPAPAEGPRRRCGAAHSCHWCRRITVPGSARLALVDAQCTSVAGRRPPEPRRCRSGARSSTRCTGSAIIDEERRHTRRKSCSPIRTTRCAPAAWAGETPDRGAPPALALGNSDPCLQGRAASRAGRRQRVFRRSSFSPATSRCASAERTDVGLRAFLAGAGAGDGAAGPSPAPPIGASRAAATGGKPELAAKRYRREAEHVVTFYGKLGAHQLGNDAPPRPQPEPHPTDAEMADFGSRELVQAAALFAAAGDRDHVKVFLMQQADLAKTPIDFAIIAGFAEQHGRVDVAIAVARRFDRCRNAVDDPFGYPVTDLARRPPAPSAPCSSPSCAPKSAFDQEAMSSVGARELMQLRCRGQPRPRPGNGNSCPTRSTG